MVVFRRTERNITSTMEVIAAPDDPVEIRRIPLQNNVDLSRDLRLDSYGEEILTPQAVDSRHPAFNKLFIDSEFIPELNLQIFKYRPRSNQETTVYMGHMLTFPANGKKRGMRLIATGSLGVIITCVILLPSHLKSILLVPPAPRSTLSFLLDKRFNWSRTPGHFWLTSPLPRRAVRA